MRHLGKAQRANRAPIVYNAIYSKTWTRDRAKLTPMRWTNYLVINPLGHVTSGEKYSERSPLQNDFDRRGLHWPGYGQTILWNLHQAPQWLAVGVLRIIFGHSSKIEHFQIMISGLRYTPCVTQTPTEKAKSTHPLPVVLHLHAYRCDHSKDSIYFDHLLRAEIKKMNIKAGKTEDRWDRTSTNWRSS